MTTSSPRIALFLGGGGLKGFAHIGVLQALEERGLRPSIYAGTSIGALIATAHACGVSTAEMAEQAERLRRRDLFRINHVGMLVDRMQAPSLYLEEPLRALVESVVPHRRLRDLPAPVLVNTVDVERGTQMVWGLPGLDGARADEAVYASCALPGFFPPGRVEGRRCIDGGTINNLSAAFAGAAGADAVIAVDVGSADLARTRQIGDAGFATIFMRAATVMMGALQARQLAQHVGPPILLVRPPIGQIGWFTFGRAAELIAAGREAADAALADLDQCLAAPGGIYPRRAVHLRVDRSQCVGCGVCVALAPDVMAIDAERRAYPLHAAMNWSPADGDFVRQCPTHAIHMHPAADDATCCDAQPTAAEPGTPRGPRIKGRM